MSDAPQIHRRKHLEDTGDDFGGRERPEEISDAREQPANPFWMGLQGLDLVTTEGFTKSALLNKLFARMW
jgi:hypothetical protein